MKGFEIKLLSVYGVDRTVVESARISFNNFTEETEMNAKDKGLLSFLMREGHLSCWEQVEARYLITCSIYVARQIFRSRMFNVNEKSLRYVEVKDNSEEIFIPLEFRGNAENVKQGSSGPIDDQIDAAKIYIDSIENSLKAYEDLLETGVCREQSRGVLPMATKTSFILKGDLRNLFHFFSLRLDRKHAQSETADVAEEMYNLLKPHFPESCKAFENHILGATTFSKKESDLIKQLFITMDPRDKEDFLSKLGDDRAKRIFEEKLV